MPSTRQLCAIATTTGLGLALAGCAAGRTEFAHSTSEEELAAPAFDDVYAVRTPGRIWVGDSLGIGLLAAHDPEIALAVALGPDGNNTYTLPDPNLPIARALATVGDDQED